MSANKDLTSYIDMDHLKILNVTQDSNVKFLFEDCLNVVESRVDPQILVVISTTSACTEFLNHERSILATYETVFYRDRGAERWFVLFGKM